MTAPPGIARTSTLRCSTGSEDRIDKLIRAAHKAIADAGVTISPRRVNKIVRRFCMNARKQEMSFREFLSVEDPEMARIFAYRLDPVGENAVDNVFRERGF